VDELIGQNKVVVFERSIDLGVTSRLSTASSVPSENVEFLSSISLPSSIAQQFQTSNLGLGLYFSFYESSVMFPIAPSSDPSVIGGSHVASPVIMATVSRTIIENLKETVNFTIANNVNYTAPVCVSWDFRAAGIISKMQLYIIMNMHIYNIYMHVHNYIYILHVYMYTCIIMCGYQHRWQRELDH